MSRLDHTRTNSRERMARQGVDNVSDHGLPAGLFPPTARPSKAALREELANATARITRTVSCRCGHSGTVTVPASRARAKLRCSSCGEVAHDR